MPLGPIIGALAGGLASAGASAIGGALFGGGGSKPFTPPNVNAGGLTANFANGGYTTTASQSRLGLVNQIAASYGPQAAAIGALRQSVAPGFSALRQARLAQLESSRQAAIGDLRDNLSSRRVLGSSFAQDALTRANLSYAQQADQIKADSFLQELDLTNQLTQQQFDAQRSQFTTALDEMNLEANMATQLTSQATAQLGANAQVKQQLDAQNAAGAGKLFGTAFAPLGTAVSNQVSNWLTPMSSAA